MPNLVDVHPPRRGLRGIAVTGLALAAFAATVVSSAPAWAADLPVPAGYTVAAHDAPADGVEHLTLTRTNPSMVVNVARITAGAPVSLRAVLSNDQVAGDGARLETVSSMCARVHCLVGVNGDFFGADSEPLGGFVTDGALLRSPSPTQNQLSLTDDGKLTDQRFTWSGKLLPTDLQPLNLDGVNVARPAGKVVLYTPAFGASTETTTPGAELVLRVVDPAGEFRLDQTARVELVALHDGVQNGAIPPDGAVLAGEGAGADALRALWARVGSGAASNQALLRLSADEDVTESLGGSPILVRDGKRWFGDPGDDFTDGRHPRTIVGWTAAGDELLVTVDGRQPDVSVGMSLYEATDFMIALGATDAINLDGGGSSTFVQGGTVVNSPSDVQVKSGGKTLIRHSVQKGDTLIGHVERPVATALVVVPSIAVSVPPVDPLAGVALGLKEQALGAPLPSDGAAARSDGAASAAGTTGESARMAGVLAAGDVASAPDGRLPALVGPRPKVGSPLVRVAVLVDVTAIVALLSAVMTVRRRRGLRVRHPAAAAARSDD